jgi:ribose transport system ATP-binding protein
VLAFVACSMFAAAGGVMLSSQVGIGDARLGGTYALTSITAVVLGGASIFGGRGSFVGAFLGACLLQTIFSATTFLSLGTAWQYWLPGILVLVAAGLFSRARGIRAAALAGEGAT